MKSILIFILSVLSFNLFSQTVPAVTNNSIINFEEGNNSFRRTVSDLLALAPSSEIAIVNSRAELKALTSTGLKFAYVTNSNFQGLFLKSSSGTANDATIVEFDTVGSGTGVWIRDFEKEVDPKWWVGISGSDDAAAILSAYNYCRSNLYNIGFSPNKTYTYGAGDSTIFSSVGRDIYINGNNATINVGATTAAWVFDNAQRIFIDNIKFVGNATHSNPFTTTFPSASSEGTFMRFNGSNCGNIWITNCRFTQFGAYAIDIIQTAGSTGYYKGINMSKCFFFEAPMDVNSGKQFCIKASNATEYHTFNELKFEKVPRIYWGASNGANTLFNNCTAANLYAQQQRHNATVGTVTISGGVIQHIALTNAGAGYETAPTVSISGDGTGAAATATLAGGQITGIVITNGGTGYTSATVTLTTNFGEVIGAYHLENRETLPKASAVLSGGTIGSILVDYPGVGYAGTPTVVITPALGGAAATAVMMSDGSGRLQSITVTNPGSGYSSAPTITFTGSSAGSNFGKFQLIGGKYNHIEHGASGQSNLGGSPLVTMLGVSTVPSENRQLIWKGVEALVVGNNSGTNNNSAVVIAKNAYVEISGGGIQGKSDNGACVRLVNCDSAIISDIYILNGDYGLEAKDCAGLRINWQTVWGKDRTILPYNFTGTTTVFNAWLNRVYADGVTIDGLGTIADPLEFLGVVTDNATLDGNGTAGDPLLVAPRDYEPHNFFLADKNTDWELGSVNNELSYSWTVPADFNLQYLESIDWYTMSNGDGTGEVNIPKFQVIDPSYDPDTRVGRVVLANTGRQVSTSVCLQMKTGMKLNFFMDSVQSSGTGPRGLGANITFSPLTCIPGDGNLVPSPQYAAVLDQAVVLGATKPSFGEQYAQNNKMIALYNAGFFSKLDALYIFTRGSKEFARINWMQPGNGDMAYTSGSSNITWTSGVGLVNTITGDQSGTYATLFDPDGTTSYYKSGDATIGVVTGSDPSGEAGRLFSNSASPRTRMVSASSNAHIMNNNTAIGTYDLDGAGFKALVREAAETNTVRVYKDGGLVGSPNVSSTPTGVPPEIRLWGESTNGFTGEIRAVFIGKGLTATEIGQLNSILSSGL